MRSGGRVFRTLALMVVLLASAPPVSADHLSMGRSSSPSAEPSAAPASGSSALRLVAVGDSIPFNSPADCPGCTGFVQRYGDALAEATGRPVQVTNLSQHNNQVVDGLVAILKDDQMRIAALGNADAIIVGIAHNDLPMNRDDDACDGATQNPTAASWAKYDDACIAHEVERFRPSYEEVFSRIAALRAGKPTILRTINRYNDWIGWPGHPL